MAPKDPRARYLPPGFPLPEPEALEQLRRNIVEKAAPAHPPEPAELAALVAADEAGIDLYGIDAVAVWQQPVEERRAVFRAIAKLLGELAGG